METFAQIPLAVLLERIERSLTSISDFQTVMKARQHLEESAIGSFLKMSKINIYPNEFVGSSSEKLFGYLKN